MKLAIFVEGLTERLFVERLISEIAGRKNIRIRIENVSGKSNARRLRLISDNEVENPKGYVLIRDSQGDHNVASDVRDNYQKLVNEGYVEIVGLRDLFPKPESDLPILLGLSRRSLNFKLPTIPFKVTWIIAVMEIEAWFLAEFTHFSRISPQLTRQNILASFGIDIETENMEKRPNPAKDLNTIYEFAGLSYIKKSDNIKNTVENLDFAIIYTSMSHVRQLNLLVDTIDGFVSSCLITV